MEPPRSTPAPLLSPQQCCSYDQLTASIVQYTMAQYANFLSSERIVNPQKWKPLKSRQKISIYRSREETVIDDLTNAGLRAQSTWQPMAKLLCVGTIDGRLDDVMYGAITPTESAMATRSLYINDEFSSHRVLQDIEPPTSADPFRYLGLKWVARSPSLAAIIRPRDTVYVEASGITTIASADGHERVGYVVYETVDSPEIDASLPTKGRLVRARVSACYLFRQAGPNVVELYATMVSNAGGNVPPKLAALSGAAVMISVSKVVDCALKKKLTWMRNTQAVPTENHTHREKACRVCMRGLSVFRSVDTCKICAMQACSRCVTARSLAVTKPNGKLAKESTPMCKSCVATAIRAENGAELATREFVHEDYVASKEPSRSKLGSEPLHVDSGITFSSSSSSSRVSHISYDSSTPHSQSQSQPQSPTEAVLLSGRLLLDDLDDLDEEVAVEPSPTVAPAVYSEKTELWMRMNALRMQAEHTFLVVSQQTQAQSQSQPPSQSLRRSELD